MMCKKEQLQEIIGYAFSAEGNTSTPSKNAAIGILNAICHWYNEKHKGNKSSLRKSSGDEIENVLNKVAAEEDDEIIMQGSDEE